MPIEVLEPEMEAFLLRIAPDLPKRWKGATPEQIAQIEQIAGRPLPSFYHWFLSRMGENMGPLTYLRKDFSAKRILECYADGWVEPHPQFLLIADASDDMQSHLYYDLDDSARDDALVTIWYRTGEEDVYGYELYERYETLREMLASCALSRFRIDKMPQTCGGTFSSKHPDMLSLIDPVMRDLGFQQPISTGPYCRIYERPDAAMDCKGMPRHGMDSARSFNLGGSDAATLKNILDEIAVKASLKVDVNEWTPPYQG